MKLFKSKTFDSILCKSEHCECLRSPRTILESLNKLALLFTDFFLNPCDHNHIPYILSIACGTIPVFIVEMQFGSRDFGNPTIQVNKPLILDRRKAWKARTRTRMQRGLFRNARGLHPCWTPSSGAWAVFPPSFTTIRGSSPRTKHFSPLQETTQDTRMALERQVRAKV